MTDLHPIDVYQLTSILFFQFRMLRHSTHFVSNGDNLLKYEILFSAKNEKEMSSFCRLLNMHIEW